MSLDSRKLGKTTFFTASQVADAQKFLAMAGFNPDQILKATPNVVKLALAGDRDVGMAADIATNISTHFGIIAENLNEVNDVLAKVFVSSNTNMIELGQAFKYAASAAAAAGQSIEEVGAAMAILANNGIKAD
jgi:TP901 family phage tail tape measure protein